MAAAEVLQDDGAADRLMHLDRCTVAPPEPHLLAGKREIARRRERAVAAAKHRDFHDCRSFPRKRVSSSFFSWLWVPAFAGTSGESFSRSTKCCTLPIALRGSASTNTYSR